MLIFMVLLMTFPWLSLTKLKLYSMGNIVEILVCAIEAMRDVWLEEWGGVVESPGYGAH